MTKRTVPETSLPAPETTSRHRKTFLRARRLVLSHRYSKLNLTVGDILGAHGSATMCYVYWDCTQNYMDVTHPLSEMPMLEKYRPLDPVTVEHDQQTGRLLRYWRDMDEATYKQKTDEMYKRCLEVFG